MTALKAIGSYVLMTVVIFAFLWWFFDKPQEHDTLITVLTAFFASASACGIIEENSLDENERLVNAVITAVVTSGFWIWQFYDGYNDLAEMFPNDKIVAAIGNVIDAWEYLVMAAISFLVIISSAKKS
ncbi:MAG: hypothetical protein IJ685_10455 [Selenomonadaceae bacterium]|nr:hypothetical protein [Selenomonadaceae bacterium]